MAIKATATITLTGVVDVAATYRYYLLQGSTLSAPAKPTTNPPGGSWALAEPTYQNNSTNTLYFCDLTVFSDGTWAYSDVSVSSSYEAAKAAWNKAQTAQDAADAAQDAVDDLQIGGRNLYIDSTATDGYLASGTDTITTSSNSTYRSRTSDYIPVTPGEKLVAQLWDESDTTNNNLAPWWQFQWYSDNDGAPEYMSSLFRTRPGVNYKMVSITVPENAAWCRIGSRHLMGDGIRARIKLERGTKPTDWSPAPEDVDSAVGAAAALAEKALGSTEVIVGTQTAATGAWTGLASFSALADGQTILYWLPFAGTSSNATLELTLAGGGTTGEIPVYIDNKTRCTTHISAGNMVQMVYRENVNIGGSTYTGWWISRSINSNTYDRLAFNKAVKAKAAITSGRLIVGDSGGYFPLAAGSAFSVDLPILYAGSNIALNATGTGNYLSYTGFTMRNTAGSDNWTATSYATLYLAGTLSGNTFTAASSGFLTTAPSDESLTYISLGYMYSTYQMYLYPEHPMYQIVGGVLKAVSQIAYEAFVDAIDAQDAAQAAQATADENREDFRRVVRIDDDGLHVGDTQHPGSEVLIATDAVNVVTGGLIKSRFAGSYIQFGNYQLRQTADGGLAFKMKEE